MPGTAGGRQPQLAHRVAQPYGGDGQAVGIAPDLCAQVHFVPNLSQLGQEADEVGRGEVGACIQFYGGKRQALLSVAFRRQPPAFCRQRRYLDVGMRQFQAEVGQRRLAAVARKVEGERIDAQSAPFAHVESLHPDVERVVRQAIQLRRHIQVLQFDVGRREPFLCAVGNPALIPLHVAAPDQQLADAQVDRCVPCGVFRGKGVDEELEVRIALFALLVEVGPHAEELGIADADAFAHKVAEAQAGCHAGYAQHLLTLQVPHLQVVHNQPAVPTHLQASHFHLGSGQVLEQRFHALSQPPLYRWDTKQQKPCQVYSHDSAYQPLQNAFCVPHLFIFGPKVRIITYSSKENLQNKADYQEKSINFA